MPRRAALAIVFSLLLLARCSPARADQERPFAERLGPSASVGLGAGYSFAEGESGGVSIAALADLGWFFTDRFAVLLGVTLVSRPGIGATHYNQWRLGAEYRLDSKHYLRFGVAYSILGRDERDPDVTQGVETIGKGEGAFVLAGVPAGSWGWGEVSFQVVAGAGYHHGADTEASYAAFGATCLEVAIR